MTPVDKPWNKGMDSRGLRRRGGARLLSQRVLKLPICICTAHRQDLNPGREPREQC
jgi:hypothetical protein